MTLVEVIIAIVLFTLVVIPIMNVFSYSLKLERRALIHALATYTAQMKMEEAYGLAKDELLEYGNDSGIIDDVDLGDSIELFYQYETVEYPVDGDDLGLYKITITIGNDFYGVSATLENIISARS